MNQVDLDSVSLLLHRAKAGCGESQNQLIDRLQGYMVLMAGQYSDKDLARKIGASDIVQQSMVNVVRGFGNFRGETEGEFKTWLKTVLQNEMHRIYRDLHRQKRNIGKEKPLDFSKNGIKGSLVDSARTPQSDAIHQERLLQMKKAIQHLPEDYATVVRLRSLANGVVT